jgi:CubicO group peptidase (beta-lactamase class C family)
LHAFRDLYSTAEENIRFMRALLRGELFDDPATLDVMTSGWTRFGFKLVPTSPGWPIEYGHGIMRFRIPRLFSPRRATPEVIGHTGVSGSWLFYCRELDLILAGTVDQVSAAAMPFSFVPMVLRDLGAVAGRVPASLDGAAGWFLPRPSAGPCLFSGDHDPLRFRGGRPDRILAVDARISYSRI